MLTSRKLTGSRRARKGRHLALLACAVALTSCGDDEAPPGGLQPSSSFAGLCATPRSGTDPATSAPYRDRQGTVADEKAWLRSWTDELYLWYREVPGADPSAYVTPLDYFAVLKTPATTSSGRPKDQFHFTLPTADTQAQFQAGIEVGYGIRWDVVAPRPPREVRVAYVEPEPHVPAANVGANLVRGALVLEVDGVDVVSGADTGTLNAGLFPSTPGETHTLVVLDAGGAVSRSVTLTAAAVTTTPVQNVKMVAGTTVGYVQFNDHFATAETQLIDAVTQLAGATDLVLDLRYNGGGYLYIASELAFMIAGPARTASKAFEKIVFNDKYPNQDPVAGSAVVNPFRTAGSLGQALPHLDLPRVFVLTGSGTCSASESIINSLQGVDVQVVQIGAATCGKPYGFYPQDNCATTYFSIEFQGVNAKGFGDYADGFTPGGSGGASPPGCLVAEDWGHALGDPAEARLAAALEYGVSQTCPPAATGLARSRAALTTVQGGAVARPPWRENRIVPR